MENQNLIVGAKSGGSARTPVEAPNSLQSIAYARILDLVSEGEIAGPVNGLQSVFIDETPLANADGTLNFQNVTIEYRSGTQAQDHIPGFPDVENEIRVGVELRYGVPWVRGITNSQVDAVNVRLSVPALSKTNTSNGDVNGHTINYVIEVAADGGTFERAVASAFSGKTTNKYERSHRIDLPPSENGWTIRVRRTTINANSGSTIDQTFVESITEITDAKLRYPNSALFGIAIDAKQFQNIPTRSYDLRGRIVRVPSNYNPETRAYTGIWDGTFKPAWTDNPAWIFYDLVTNERFGLGHLVTTADIDKWGLYKIARYCDEMVPVGDGTYEPRFTCSVYLQTRQDAYKVLMDLASVFRGMTFWAGGQIMCVADMPGDADYLYNGSNVVEGKFVYQGSARRARHTVALVSWNDLSDFGRAKVEYVEDAEGIERYGVQQLEVTAVGCTSRSQARRLGRWMLLTERYETDTVTFSVGLDGAIAAPGQIIMIADEDRAGRRIGGRIADAGDNWVRVDAAPHVFVGDSISVVLPDGTTDTRQVMDLSPDKRTLIVSTPFAQIPVAQSAWILESATLSAQRYRVLSVTEGEGLTYTITALQHVEGKFDEVDLGIPFDEPNTTALPPKVILPPTNIVIEHRDVAGDVVAGKAVTITWDPVAGAVGYKVEWRQGEGEWQNAGTTAGTTFDIYGVQPGPFQTRITAISSTGQQSNPGRNEEDVDVPDVATKPTVIRDIEDSVVNVIAAVAQEGLDRAAADAAEAQERANAIAAEANARIAAVAAETQARVDAILAESQARIAAISDISIRVEEAEGVVTDVAEQITVLAASNDVSQAALASDLIIRQSKDNVLAQSNTLLKGRMEAAEGTVQAAAQVVQTYETRLEEVDGRVTAANSALTSLSNELEDAKNDVAANATAVGGLQTRVTAAEGEIEAQSSDITQLGNTLTDTRNDLTAASTAISGLTTRVSNAEGQLTSQSESITQLGNNIAKIGGDNMLPNSSFEEQATTQRAKYWTATNGGSGTISGFQASFADSSLATSTKALRLEATALGPSKYIESSYYATDGIPNPKVEEGKQYVLTSHIRGTPGASIALYVQFLNASGTTIATATLTGVTATDKFVRHTVVTNPAPAGAVAVRCYAGRMFGASGDLPRWMEVDNVQLQEGTVATPYKPSTVYEAGGTALQTLTQRVSTAEGNIASQSTATTALTDRMTTAEGKINTQATAISTLQTNVSNQDGRITTNSQSITSLGNRLTNAETGVSGNASALSTLQTTVTQQGNTITSQASQLTSLTSTVGGHTTTITQYGTTINGLQGRVGVTIDANGYMTGWSLNNNGQSGSFAVRADLFSIVSPSGGARTEFSGGNWRVYDSNGVMRVRMGVW